MTISIDNPDNYKQVLATIKARVTQSQYEALKAVNRELIQMYWDIGRIIVEKQAQFGWGENIVERLSKDLHLAYPGIRGFAVRNVRYMRTFYLTYKADAKLQSLIAEIGWTHHLKI